MHYRTRNWLIVLAGILIVWFGHPFVARNFEAVMERYGWDQIGNDLIDSFPAWSLKMAEWLPNGYWAGAFSVLLIWGVLEAFYALLRRPAESASTSPPVADKSLLATPSQLPNSESRFREGDHDLVPRGLQLKAIVSKDGADITAFITIRNRSLQTLFTASGKGTKFEIDGRPPPPGKRGGGLNMTMSAGTNQQAKFGPIRILDAKPGVKGYLVYAVRFGTDKDKLLDILSLRYDFTINTAAIADGRPNILDCDIKETIGYSRNSLVAAGA